METKIFATTKENYIASQAEFNDIGGKAAGVCYLPNTLESLINEDPVKTQKRVERTLLSGHHSPYDHSFITLEFIDIPKIVAMMINNEKMYTTSEKSARYKKMVLPENEQEIYNKWMEIFKTEITKKYGETFPEFFDKKRIVKLAQENARYLTSVFTPTTMLYTVSYRQLNNLIAFAEKEMDELSTKNDKFSIRLESALDDFHKNLTSLPYYNKALAGNDKNRSFSLIKKDPRPTTEYFGDIYITSYDGSFAQLAQAQRHRTISYNMQLKDETEFYIPPIIAHDTELVNEWLNDCKALQDIFPQGTMVRINETSTLENFLLKAKERECTMAQLEICNQTKITKEKMYNALVASNHPKAEDLIPYMHGARCTFPDYTCSAPCKFKEGITEMRQI